MVDRFQNYWDAEDIRETSGDIACFTLSERSRKLCLAILDAVNKDARYDGAVTQDEIDGWQAELAYQLMGDNTECAPEIAPDDPCTLYPPTSLFIEYAPNDPFQTPDLVPPGYLFVPPWYTNPGIPLPGVLPGDAMVNLLAIGVFGDLGGLIESGLPRFRVTVEGEGEVELEFVKVPQGGNVLVIIDGNPLEQQLFDLNALPIGDLSVIEDLFDIVIGESLVSTEICEVHFATGGIHTIDVTFIPNIAVDVIVGFGGGLRRVSLCGVTEVGESVNMPQFQIVDCELQWRPNGSAAWETLVDLCEIQPPTVVRQDQTPPGNLEQDIGGAGFTEIANTDFLWRGGQYPMTGGLEIYPTADEALLTLKGVGAPYQTAKIMRVQDSAGVDVAWINPRGDISLGLDANSYSAYLLGRIGMENNQGIYWKDAVALSRIGLSGLNGQTRMHAMGAGFGFYNATGGQVGIFGETGVFALGYASGAGASRLVVTSSPGSVSSYPILEADQDGASKPVFGVRKGGETFHYGFDAGTSNVFDTVIVGHESSAAAAADFGAAIKWTGKSSTTGFQQMARLFAQWEVATHASRAAKVKLTASDYSGEKVLIEGGVTGANTPKLGVLGATPQPRLAITGDTYGIPALQEIIAAMDLFGWVTDASTSDQPLANVCDLRCQIAIGGYTVIATHIFDMAVTIAALSPTSSLAEVIASSQVRAAWDYKIFSPTFADMVGYFYSYPDQEGMAADLLALYEELIHRVWCELDECGQPNATWQIDIAAALLAWPEDDAHYLIGQAFNTIFSSEADQSLSAGFAVVPFGAVDCSTFDCVFDEPPPPPPPEFDWCREYDFTVGEYWDITGIPPSSGPDGEYTAAGYIGECSGDCAVAIRYIYPEQVNIRRVTCTFIIDEDPIEEPQTPEYSLHYGSAFHLLKAQSFSTEGLKTVVWTGSIDTDRLRIICASGGQVVQGQVTITSVKVEGNSDAPTTDPGADCNV